MNNRMAMAAVLAALAFGAWAEAPKRGVPSGCDPSVMSGDYWSIWNAEEQARIDADIEQNRKADAVFEIDAPAGTEVKVEQLDHAFRFGAHIFNFNQLGKTEYNDAYKASYGKGGLFNQATVAFYWKDYEPEPGKLRAHGSYEDTEAYWNSLSFKQAQLDRYWRRPAPGSDDSGTWRYEPRPADPGDSHAQHLSRVVRASKDGGHHMVEHCRWRRRLWRTARFWALHA